MRGSIVFEQEAKGFVIFGEGRRVRLEGLVFVYWGLLRAFCTTRDGWGVSDRGTTLPCTISHCDEFVFKINIAACDCGLMFNFFPLGM